MPPMAEDDQPKVGLGAWFYGQWWSVPLARIDAVGIHITALELMEIGLGVVTVGPWLKFAQRKRIKSDALAAVLVLAAVSFANPVRTRWTKADRVLGELLRAAMAPSSQHTVALGPRSRARCGCKGNEGPILQAGGRVR